MAASPSKIGREDAGQRPPLTQIGQMLDHKRKMSIRAIAATLDLSYGTIQRAITLKLGFKKLDTRCTCTNTNRKHEDDTTNSISVRTAVVCQHIIKGLEIEIWKHKMTKKENRIPQPRPNSRNLSPTLIQQLNLDSRS